VKTMKHHDGDIFGVWRIYGGALGLWPNGEAAFDCQGIGDRIQEVLRHALRHGKCAQKCRDDGQNARQLPRNKADACDDCPSGHPEC